MINVKLEQFKAWEPCCMREMLDKVEHLFPLTSAEDIRTVAMIWSNCDDEDDRKDYASAYCWLGVRAFDAERRKKYLDNPHTKRKRDYTDEDILEHHDPGRILWGNTYDQMWLVEELLDEQEAAE